MKLTRDGKALYMHCLPADISGVSCPEGEEVRRPPGGAAAARPLGGDSDENRRDRQREERAEDKERGWGQLSVLHLVVLQRSPGL